MITTHEFEEKVLARKSNEFHGGLVNPQGLHSVLGSFMAASDELDAVKKMWFYGKTPETDWPSSPEVDRMVQMMFDTQQKRDIVHAFLGIASETGELNECIANMINGNEPFDRINAIEEFGDILWYVALGLRSIDSSIEDAMTRVEAKLQARYGDAAKDRDLDAERNALEQDAEK